MPGRGRADVVICLDASASMRPCFDAVRQHLVDFLRGLESGGQVTWDLRFDFVAHRATDSQGRVGFQHTSLHCPHLWDGLYGRRLQSGASLFTKDLETFKRGIASLKAKGDEANF